MGTSQKVKEYQLYLNRIGGYNLKVDGMWGKRTLAAYEDAVNRGLVRPQGGTSKQTTSKPKLVPAERSDYDLMAENANLSLSLYPVEAILDWGGYKTVVSPSGKRYTVDDIRAGKYTGNVPAYIENGVLKAGNVPTNLAYNDYINDNALANLINKLAIDEYIKSEYSPERLALIATGVGPGLNTASPSNWFGAAKGIYNGKTSYEIGRGIVEGNSGVVSDEYMSKHPYMGNALNMGFDLLAYNAPALYRTVSSMFSPSRVINSIGGRSSYNSGTRKGGNTYGNRGPKGEIRPESYGGPSTDPIYGVLEGDEYRIISTPSFKPEPTFVELDRSLLAPEPKFVELNRSLLVSEPKFVELNTPTNPSIKPSATPIINPATLVKSTTSSQVNPFVPHWTTTGASLSLLPKVDGPTIVGVPYHNEVVRNFHDDGWIEKFQATPEGGVFWHNGKSYIKQTGGRDRFVRESYNDGQTPWGNSATQVYFDRGVPVVEVPWGTPTGITRTTGEDTGNINYNKAVNRNTGKSEKSKAKGK